MMAPEYYIFTGEVVPDRVTHIYVGKTAAVRARAFENHPNIEEVICHDGVLKIGTEAFLRCRRLRRVIMPGVKEVEKWAFGGCGALTYIECGKLERIGEYAFRACQSLNSIDLPSIKIVERCGFCNCRNLFSVNFGKDLESIRAGAFMNCPSLECITLPLKDGMVSDDNIFQRCGRLENVDLVGGVHETVATLLMDEWKNDMYEEIDSINRILPNTPAGNVNMNDPGGKAREIRMWIRSVLRKIVHYRAEHQIFLNMAAALESRLPSDIVFKNVLPFLAYILKEEVKRRIVQ